MGHKFFGLSRKELLSNLQKRAASLSVKLIFGSDVSARGLSHVDLILGTDDVHSPLREKFAATSQPFAFTQGKPFYVAGLDFKN